MAKDEKNQHDDHSDDDDEKKIEMMEKKIGETEGSDELDGMLEVDAIQLPLTPEEIAAKKKERRERIKAKIMHWRVNKLGKFLDGVPYNIVMFIATFFALFARDILLLALPKSLDYSFSVISTICLGLFAFDLLASTLGKPGYFPSLFFFLDLLATVSLLPDISFIWDPLLRELGTDPDQAASGARQASIARAGRAARAGTRAGRLVRLFKLFALVKKKDESGPKKDELEEPSVVGKKLAELTTKKVIVGVMLMVALLPFLSAEGPDTSFSDGLDFIDKLALRSLVSASNGTVDGTVTFEPTPFVNHTVNIFMKQQRVLYLKVMGFQIHPPNNEPYVYTSNRRNIEVSRIILEHEAEIPSELADQYQTYGIQDLRRFSQTSSLYNIILTVFIVALLATGAALFSKDANNLMIEPIERMVKIVKKLANDPLANLAEHTKRERSGDSEHSSDQLETSLVEAALVKIGGLLQVGFGEAGAKIIAKNLAAGNAVNPMIPGSICKGIFGFCDIRNFTDATECLQDEVMVFVNVIADIVHMAVKRHGGSPNKNIGDAFLVVYKAGDDVPTDNPALEAQAYAELADGSLQAFLDVISEVNVNPILLKIAKYPSIQARMPGYKTKMGFGLHYGWAIEGAIGSSLKVDASYLSPNVNIAARLESATKAYGVPLLISGNLVKLLTPKKKAICRKIDKVTLKGSKEPMELYCVDLEPPTADTFPGLRRYVRTFKKGMEHYISGEWAAAGDIFQTCLKAWPTDEPCKSLLWYMSRHNFRAPKDWAGFRELTEK